MIKVDRDPGFSSVPVPVPKTAGTGGSGTGSGTRTYVYVHQIKLFKESIVELLIIEPTYEM